MGAFEGEKGVGGSLGGFAEVFEVIFHVHYFLLWGHFGDVLGEIIIRVGLVELFCFVEAVVHAVSTGLDEAFLVEGVLQSVAVVMFGL